MLLPDQSMHVTTVICKRKKEKKGKNCIIMFVSVKLMFMISWLIDVAVIWLAYSGGGFWVGKAKSGQRHPCVYSYHGNIWVIRTFKLPFNIRELLLTIDPSIHFVTITKGNGLNCGTYYDTNFTYI
jgi:hypothetical protein